MGGGGCMCVHVHAGVGVCVHMPVCMRECLAPPGTLASLPVLPPLSLLAWAGLFLPLPLQHLFPPHVVHYVITTPCPSCYPFHSPSSNLFPLNPIFMHLFILCKETSAS